MAAKDIILDSGMLVACTTPTADFLVIFVVLTAVRRDIWKGDTDLRTKSFCPVALAVLAADIIVEVDMMDCAVK